MNLKKNHWSKEDYQAYLTYLFKFADLNYQKFQSKLTYKDNIVGIRTPILKKISKEIALGNYLEFIKYVQNNTYEEWLVFGFIIGYSKETFETKLHLLDIYIKGIDNWASCDLVCSNMKDFNNNKIIGFDYILKLTRVKQVWSVRVGVVLLINYYIDHDYIDKIFKIIDNINLDEYYVKMAIAWLISASYIKYPKKTLTYLNSSKIDNFTYNKAIQKIIESKVVAKEDKMFLKEMKKH